MRVLTSSILFLTTVGIAQVQECRGRVCAKLHGALKTVTGVSISRYAADLLYWIELQSPWAILIVTFVQLRPIATCFAPSRRNETPLIERLRPT